MANFSAIIPVAQMKSANDALELLGFGKGNFSVPAYKSTGVSHGVLHAWHDPAFQSAVEAQAGVIVTALGLDPIALTQTAITAQGAQWGAQSPSLPNTGLVTVNTLYKYSDGTQWWVIQAFNRSTYGAHPSTYPALIREMRVPNVASQWKQPIDQYDAYKLFNAFTNKPDECLYQNKKWKVSQADGAGNNVWAPGVYGWTENP